MKTVRIKGCKPFPQLPGAEKEVNMIGKILNSEPLTGKDATKNQVFSKLNSKLNSKRRNYFVSQ